ncbi:hypothetical protein ACOSQ3_025583 [Xanthoceras sorbifolium]
MQSEPSGSTISCISSVLHLLCGFASSPQAAGSVATHIKSGDGTPTPCGFCSSLVSLLGRPLAEASMCPVHNAPREDYSQQRLLESNCNKPLVDLLADEDTSVQVAGLEALSTLIIFERGIDELDQQGVLDAVITLFTDVCPGILQEQAIWMIERILRVEGHSHQYLRNQSLVRALFEPFKHSNANTKKHSQDALNQPKTATRNQRESLKSSSIMKVDSEGNMYS